MCGSVHSVTEHKTMQSDEAIISEEYTEPGFWSSCFRMFPETCTSGLHLQRKYSARGTLRL